jgi:hypothetical protein
MRRVVLCSPRDEHEEASQIWRQAPQGQSTECHTHNYGAAPFKLIAIHQEIAVGDCHRMPTM